MTKQHFIAFAQEIANSNRSTDEKAAAAWIVVRVAQQFNTRFDASRFFKAALMAGLQDDEASAQQRAQRIIRKLGLEQP